MIGYLELFLFIDTVMFSNPKSYTLALHYHRSRFSLRHWINKKTFEFGIAPLVIYTFYRSGMITTTLPCWIANERVRPLSLEFSVKLFI